MTPGPRFSATISASQIKRRAISLPSSVRRLTTVLRLLLLSSRKKKLSRFGLSAFHSRRARSPWGGRSILITSAPSHASPAAILLFFSVAEIAAQQLPPATGAVPPLQRGLGGQIE